MVLHWPTVFSLPPFFCLDTKETKNQGCLKTRLGVEPTASVIRR